MEIPVGPVGFPRKWESINRFLWNGNSGGGNDISGIGRNGDVGVPETPDFLLLTSTRLLNSGRFLHDPEVYHYMLFVKKLVKSEKISFRVRQTNFESDLGKVYRNVFRKLLHRQSEQLSDLENDFVHCHRSVYTVCDISV